MFRLNIASIRDCDPTKFNLEMGPHYVSQFNPVRDVIAVSRIVRRPCVTLDSLCRLLDVTPSSAPPWWE